MGGRGALKSACKYVELFSSVVAFAPALVDGKDLQERHPELLRMVFNGDAQRFEENSPGRWAQANAEAIRGKLPIWIICGAEDGLLPGIERMQRLLGQLEIAHELELIPGIAHNLPALAEAIQTRGFAFAAKAFGQ